MRNTLLFCLLILASEAFSQAPAPNAAVIGDVQSPGATVRGSVMVSATGTSVMSGAQISASDSNAAINLRRGGSLNVCKRSTVTLTSGSNGREMLIALDGGALETHYSLPSTSDTIMTPDFRLSLTGPGAFNFAVGSVPNGGVCVRSLPGNASSIIVSEQFGEGAHQVKPGEQITFHNGHVDDSSNDATSCGCPPAPQAVVPPAITPAANPALNPNLNFPEQQSRTAEQAVAAGNPLPAGESIPIPAGRAPKAGETVTQVDAPMVFRAEDVPPPAPKVARAKLPALPKAALLPKAEPPKPEKKPWYQRFGKAVASFFGGNS